MTSHFGNQFFNFLVNDFIDDDDNNNNNNNNNKADLATWVECETIYLWLWSFCVRGLRCFRLGRDPIVRGVFFIQPGN